MQKISYKKVKAIHYCVIPKTNNNAGDNLLYELIRKIINYLVKDFEFEWIIESQWVISKAEEINNLNVDMVLFGGGGLFLPDQKGANNTNNTGWQINIPEEEYEKILPKVYGAAIGFNWFRKSKISKSIIKSSTKGFFKKASIVGIRNYGSINEIRKILKSEEDMMWLPCATSLIKKLCEKDFIIDIPRSLKKRIITKNFRKKKFLNLAINLSCDRLDQRDISANDFKKLVKTIKSLKEQGHKITYIAHKDLDLKASELIGLEMFDKVQNISNLNSNEIFKSYLDFDIVFGGRGHSLMIPFGLGIPIVSLTTHNKQIYFLKDAYLEKFSIELSSYDSEKIFKTILWCIKNIESQKSLINQYQEKGILAWIDFANIIKRNLMHKYGI